MIIENNIETPEFWLAQRKWTKFLNSVPVDGCARAYCVGRTLDLNTIRVRAAQLNKRPDAKVIFYVSLQYDHKIACVAARKKKEESPSAKKIDEE